MKRAPQINHWREHIAGNVYAVFAERRWDSAPRYSAFVIADLSMVGHAAARELAELRLHEFERALFDYYGRHFLREWQQDVEIGIVPQRFREPQRRGAGDA